MPRKKKRQKPMSSYRGFLIALVTVVVVAIGFSIHLFTFESTETPESIATVEACHVEEPTILGRAAYVYDVQNDKTLYEKNSDAQLPLASLTKIMTALVVHRALPEDATITISEDSLLPEGSSGFEAGEQWRAKDLIDFTLITSSNDGARALALAVEGGHENPLEAFTARMNGLSAQLGLSQTYFLNDTGLDASPHTAGAYGSAYDVARLLAAITKDEKSVLHQSALPRQIFTTLGGKTYTAVHTSPLAGALPGEVAVKTGFTDLAGGNLAVVLEISPGRPFALVVLGSTREGRTADIEALYEFSKRQLKRDTLCGN